jgi:hypothetical protein
MDAIELLKVGAEIATKRLAPYVIAFDQQAHNYRVIKFCRTGETHAGCFIDREAAEDYLLSRLPQPAATKVDH